MMLALVLGGLAFAEYWKRVAPTKRALVGREQPEWLATLKLLILLVALVALAPLVLGPRPFWNLVAWAFSIGYKLDPPQGPFP